MIGAIFSFRGRLNRLQYLAGCVGLGAAAMVLAVVLVGGAIAAGGGDKAAILKAGLVGLLALIVILPVYSWISFSLQARRFRDIGWEPIFVIPAWIGFDILDRLLVLGAPQIAVAGPYSLSWLGLLVNLGLMLTLLFWPGRKDFDIASVFDDEAPPARPSPVRASAAPASARTPAPMRPVSSAPAGFGRRGL